MSTGPGTDLRLVGDKLQIPVSSRANRPPTNQSALRLIGRCPSQLGTCIVFS
jgi:hypothetical protein